MWITSQDKKLLISMENKTVGIGDKSIFMNNGCTSNFEIAKYETNEDCQVVLKRIKQCLNNRNKLYDMPTQEELMALIQKEKG